MKTGFSHESHVAKTIDWYTPPQIFEDLNLTFDIDVCSPRGGVPWIPAKHHFSLEDDGLKQDWQGTVWCNPPYGKETSVWLKRMSEHKNGIALVFARTDCKWFHEHCAKADAILFLKGRVKFVDAFGKTGGSGAGSGSMLVAWGENSVTALKQMNKNSKGFLVINS